jgi:hypothetical protein
MAIAGGVVLTISVVLAGKRPSWPYRQAAPFPQSSRAYLPSVSYRRVTVEAQNAFEAEAKLEAMYGVGKIIGVHKA